MKKFLSYRTLGSSATLLLLVFTCTLSACRGENGYEIPEPKPIVLIGQTENNGVMWRNGDRIGLFAINSGTALQNGNISGNINNLPFITNGDGAFKTQTVEVFYPETGTPLDFVAYYPFVPGIENFSVPINVLLQTDIWYSNNLTNVTATTGNKTLHFRRPLAKLVLNITSETADAALNDLTAVMTGAKTRAAFSLTNGELLIDEASEMDIRVVICNENRYQKQISMLMFPTTSTQTVEIRFGIGDDTDTWILPHALEAGITYTHNITVALEGKEPTPEVPYNFWELPVYSGTLPPTFIEARHKVGDRSWLNQNLPLPDGTIRNFTVLFDTEHRLPVWVAYPLHPIYMVSGNRTNDWGVFDPLIPSIYQPYLATPWRSLTGLRYDRGHVLPSADRSASRELNTTTFFNSNFVVQSSVMNQGVWERLEDDVRRWSRSNPSDTLYIVSGQILHPTPIFAAVDNNNVLSAKPQYMYKAILRRNMQDGTFTSIGFKMANTDNSAPHTQSVVSVSQLEEITGFTFFPRLPENIAAMVKSNTNMSAF